MRPQRAVVDAAVPLFTLGGEGEMKEACRHVLELVGEGLIDAVASVEMIQEVVFHRLRRTGHPAAAADEARDLMEAVTLIDFDRPVLVEALRLVQSGHARGRDAVHAATALVHGVTTIVTPDPDFDGIPGLRRIDPRAVT